MWLLQDTVASRHRNEDVAAVMLTTAATMETEEKMKIILVGGTVHRTGLEERNPTDSCTSLPFLDHHGKVKTG